MEHGEQPGSVDRQRLDKWLFFTRLSKSRAIAQKRIADGEVRVNGRVASQPSHIVKPGDRVELTTWRGIRSTLHAVTVRGPGLRRGPYEEARLLYEDHGSQEQDG